LPSFTHSFSYLNLPFFPLLHNGRYDGNVARHDNGFCVESSSSSSDEFAGFAKRASLPLEIGHLIWYEHLYIISNAIHIGAVPWRPLLLWLRAYLRGPVFRPVAI